MSASGYPHISCGFGALPVQRPIPTYAAFGKQLRAHRRLTGWTMGDLARRLRTSVVYVSECERGVRPMALEHLLKFAVEPANGFPTSLFWAARGPVFWALWMRCGMRYDSLTMAYVFARGTWRVNKWRLTGEARVLLDSCYQSLTGMKLPCNEYYFPDAMSEAVECAEALGL